MHIEFKHVILHNFMSFGHSELNFDDCGFVRVSGINNNPLDNAVSNGSGKSSLWESIIWALTGDTSRGAKHVVNLFGEDGCYVELDFTIDNKSYKIIRSKDHKVFKTNLQIFIDGQNCSGKGIRDSEKLLSQYLPDLTASLISSVIILGQGLPQKFTNNTPSGRKEVLEKLSKSDFMIEDLKKRVAQRKSELQESLRGFEDSILENKTKESLLLKEIEENKQIRESLINADFDLNILNKESDLYAITQKIDTIKTEITTLNNSYSAVSIEQATLSNKKTTDLYELKNKHEELTQPYLNSLNQLNGEANSIKKQINNIKSIRDVCPTCGQKLPDVHKPDTTMLELDLEAVQAKILELTSLLNDYNIKHEENVLVTEHKYSQYIEELTSKQNDLVDRLNQYRVEENELQVHKNSIDTELTKLKIERAELKTIIDNCNKIIHKNNENLKVVTDLFLYNNMQRDLAQSHLDVVSKFETALKRDFRGYLLSTVIEYIEAKAKQYCKIIFDTEDISFCLDGNNIDISYMNKAYENLSGGEQQKIDLIIQFSIRDMLSKLLNFTSNILVLDEVFDSLDMLGCSRTIELISSITDIKNIFIVTHRHDLSIPNDVEIIVAKSSAGFSEIRV